MTIAATDEKTRPGAITLGGAPEIASGSPLCGRGAPETTEEYPAVIAVLDARTRVIECRDGIQWIIQRRQGKGRDPWRGVSFCRTKEALLRLAGRHPALDALPERFSDLGMIGKRLRISA
jgi:hypothetical protein